MYHLNVEEWDRTLSVTYIEEMTDIDKMLLFSSAPDYPCKLLPGLKIRDEFGALHEVILEDFVTKEKKYEDGYTASECVCYVTYSPRTPDVHVLDKYKITEKRFKVISECLCKSLSVHRGCCWCNRRTCY